MLGGRWPLKAQPHATPAQIAELPLHLKRVARVGLAEKLRQIETLEKEMGLGARWSKTFKTILDFLTELARNKRHDPCASNLCELSAGDLEKLTSAGLLEPGASEGQGLDLRLFSVAEKWCPETGRYLRRRFIAHTPLANESAQHVLDSLGFADLPSQFDCVSDCASPHFSQCDIAWCYGGFLLEPHLRLWGARLPGGGVFRLTTIPTGASWCPLLAHTFTDCVASFCAWKISPPDGSGAQAAVRHRAFIDNVRFLARDAGQCAAAMRLFFDVAKKFNFDINESFEEAAGRRCIGTFLGVVYNHADHYITFSPKLLAKLSAIAALTASDFSSFSLRQIVSIWGVLTHASQISCSTRGEFYHFVKFLRRRANEQAPLDTNAGYWPCLGDAPAQWARKEISCARRDFLLHDELAERHVRRVTIFSDATPDGYGITAFFPDGTQTIIAGKWEGVHEKAHINELEARAVLLALDLLQDELRRKRRLHDGRVAIELFVDNTSAIHCLKKGASRSFFLNRVVCAIRAHGAFHTIEKIAYIKSAENPADWLSRLRGVGAFRASGFATAEPNWRRRLDLL